MTPEGRVKQQLKEELKRQGCWFFMPPANGFGRSGIPDIIACVPVEVTEKMVGRRLGVLMGVEVKAPGKLRNVTELQKRSIQEINDHSGVAFATDNLPKMLTEINRLRSTNEGGL